MECNVLLIDDNPEFISSIKRDFTDVGIPLDVAETWQQGIEKFHISLYELVIADYNLPGSDNGLKLLANVKPLKPSSKLVLISGMISSVPAEMIKIQGLVDNYFEKDVDISSKLIEEAKKAIKSAKMNTDWKSVAKAHLQGITINEKFVKEIDDLIRKDIGK